MMTVSEKTHSLVPLEKQLSGRVLSQLIRDNVRLIRDNATDSLCLYVLSELDQNTEFLDLKQALRTSEVHAGVTWCNRAELSQIVEQFSAISDTLISASDYQNINLTIIDEAVRLRASDIHYRIWANYTSVLFRIDGNLREIKTESVEWGTRVCNTLFNSMGEEHSQPVLSYTEPCDARVREEFVNGFGLSTIRFASRPGGQGRLSVALRLVSRRKQSLSFSQLGLTPPEETKLRRTLLSSGATIYSGPTGHGKSIACQCSAEFLAKEDPGENFMSVEDPIESPIAGVFQTPRGKQTYGEALRNLLRMDPDRLYGGEARDADSTVATIEAVLTGVPVITTTHTNSPADVLQRFRKFGVELDLLFDPTIISGLVGLRLVPLLCESCRISWSEGRENVSPVMQDLVETYTKVSGVFLRRPGGCDCCGNTGIKGRIGVFEVIETDNRFMRLYSESGKMAAYLDWIERGGVTLCQNMLRVINEGRTDPVWAHRRICNLNRDARLRAGEEL